MVCEIEVRLMEEVKDEKSVDEVLDKLIRSLVTFFKEKYSVDLDIQKRKVYDIYLIAKDKGYLRLRYDLRKSKFLLCIKVMKGSYKEENEIDLKEEDFEKILTKIKEEIVDKGGLCLVVIKEGIESREPIVLNISKGFLFKRRFSIPLNIYAEKIYYHPFDKSKKKLLGIGIEIETLSESFNKDFYDSIVKVANEFKKFYDKLLEISPSILLMIKEDMNISSIDNDTSLLKEILLPSIMKEDDRREFERLIKEL